MTAPLKTTRFTYGDSVRTSPDAPLAARPGTIGCIVGLTTESRANFPEGTVYLIEFTDGSSAEVHETHLAADDESNDPPA